ncbi:MAG: septal ring lytic transglycosylase RlpA family protein [Phormidesmis sp. RL_2_1]|nr:septal ring lytic transglycosylase RlpA family protein [Phormidesmis sp. RL_2_1]
MMRSFTFFSQAFQTAQIGNIFARAQPSAAVPIQWARSNHWQSWAAAADIEVTPVQTMPQMSHLEHQNRVVPLLHQCLSQVQTERQLAPRRYRLSLKNKTLGYVANEARADLLAQQLRRLIRRAAFTAETIQPSPTQAGAVDSDFIVTANNQPLFVIDDAMAEAVGYSKEWAAVAWANNLRLALDNEPLSVGEAQMALENLQPSTISFDGEASWYGPYFHGRPTANGETYNQNDLTVAHKSLPFGTYLKVRNLINDKTVVVRVNDRGPYVGDRSLDLSKAAADCLGSEQVGVIPYEAVILKQAN